jgi:hypothetical protein
MKIELRKISNTPLDFEITSNNIDFKGYLQYHSGKLILLHAKLSGFLDIDCNLCGKDINLPVNEDIEFFISDGIFQDEDDIELDVVESLDSKLDLEDVLNSEIELIKSGYFTCEECQNS